MGFAPRWAAALVLCGLGLAACGPPSHTITADEALKIVNSRVQQTLREVPTSLAFGEKEIDTDDGSACVRPLSGSGFTGQITPSLEYIAARVSPTQALGYMDAVQAYWKRQPDIEISRSSPELMNVHFQDGYRIWMSYYEASKELDFGGAGECIWRAGTPQPTDAP
ncbi:hypothetical protein ABZ897_31260 [Nonomuraea sp. NPDC046802]|uniref:hypothetical protein n=1 Tax=Nonomuraea sp. NPDC046802 TaxID=3154919 RepID=UPI0033F70740